MGISDVRAVLTHNDLARGGDVIFAATGITDGDLLQGVRYFGDQASTHSLVMRAKTGTIRFVEATHRLERKPMLNELIRRQQ
jgi:fructose-1,6-bisphosphatase II